jgi:hypothetical protein
MKNWKMFCAISVLVGAACLETPLALAATFQFVGSFVVDNGVDWNTNPPVYTGQEAAALLFGGSAANYAISTNSNTTDPATITHTAWYDGWGEPCSEFAENFSLDVAPPGYRDPGGLGTSWSAYVSDHGCGQTNYVWRRIGAAAATPVPTLDVWALIALAMLLCGVALIGSRQRL